MFQENIFFFLRIKNKSGGKVGMLKKAPRPGGLWGGGWKYKYLALPLR